MCLKKNTFLIPGLRCAILKKFSDHGTSTGISTQEDEPFFNIYTKKDQLFFVYAQKDEFFNICMQTDDWF
jgi:hypothetical protein